MCTRNKITGISVLWLLLTLAVPAADPGAESFQFTEPHGLKITMLEQKDLEYVKAHLLIRFQNRDRDPSLPFLTVINLFDPVRGGYKSNLLSSLYKMGNDFKVSYGYDHIIIKINFLPDHIEEFARFVRILFTFNFTNIEKFEHTKKHLFEIFKKDQNWQHKLATQIAYDSIFQGHSLGNSFVFKNSLEKFNIVQIRSFLKQSIIPAHSLLTLKGDLNPYVSWGILKKELSDLDVNVPANGNSSSPAFTPALPEKSIFIYPIQLPAPRVFTFMAGKYSPELPVRVITNELLYGKFTGLILRKQEPYQLRLLEIDNHLNKHRNHYVFSNSFIVEYPDLGNLLRLISDLSRNYRSNITELSRTDLLESIYFIKNYNTVQNSDLETNMDNRLYDKFTRNFPPFDPEAYYAKPTLYISHLRNHSAPLSPRQYSAKPLIVIFGDPDMILRRSPDLEGQTVLVRENDYFID